MRSIYRCVKSIDDYPALCMTKIETGCCAEGWSAPIKMSLLSMEIFTENFTMEILEKNIVPLFIMFLASFIASFIILELLSDQKFEGIEYDEDEDEEMEEMEEHECEEMEDQEMEENEELEEDEENKDNEEDEEYEEEETVELLGLSRVNMEYVLRKYGGIGVTYEVAVEVDYDLFGSGEAPISRRLLEQFLEQQGAQRLSDSQWSKLVSIYPYYPEDEEDEEDERIPFACRARKNDRIVRHGTFNTNTRLFEFDNGLHAYSPSAACQVILKRRGVRNEWQGPSHVYLYVNRAWVVFKDTEYY